MRLLITHKISEITIAEWGLKPISARIAKKLVPIKNKEDEILFTKYDGFEILYIPTISERQKPNELRDQSIFDFATYAASSKPDIIVTGNNACPRLVIEHWRTAVGSSRTLMIIRRGVDTRAIDKSAAKANDIVIANLPGINSPFVAEHMLKFLRFDLLKPESKVAIIGTGNIGTIVANAACHYNLKTTVFSPSLADARDRTAALKAKQLSHLPIECAHSLESALKDATTIAIAIPLENSAGHLNQEFFTAEHVKRLKAGTCIVSCSVPHIFTKDALTVLNDSAANGKVSIRIDTAPRHVIEIKANWPHFDAACNEAFASEACQRALDIAFFNRAKEFLQKYRSKTGSAVEHSSLIPVAIQS